jgi:hypothetical protein
MTFDPNTVKRISIADYPTMVDAEDYDKAMQFIVEMEKVVEASRCIRHWHDTLNNEGMVVSAHHVRLLWKALTDFDKAKGNQ